MSHPIFQPHSSSQSAAAAAAAHQSHIDQSLIHLISPTTIQDYKKANQQQLLNPHHTLIPSQLIPQLNLASLNPATLAAVENAQVLHSRNLRSPHHNLSPQTSIRTGTVSHSNESDLNSKLKHSNSSSQLSLKQQQQLQAQLQQQQLQAQIHQQHLQHQQAQQQQQSQPNFFKKRLLSTFEAPSKSSSSSNVKNNIGHGQLKGSTQYEMLSDSEDS
jgi:hypothetical protein